MFRRLSAGAGCVLQRASNVPLLGNSKPGWSPNQPARDGRGYTPTYMMPCMIILQDGLGFGQFGVYILTPPLRGHHMSVTKLNAGLPKMTKTQSLPT